MATKRNLLLCLDAFGTIFTPRESIAAQYGGVARSFGVNVDDEQVMKSFKSAFKEESKAHPNFGRAVGLGANKWWTNVITKTFQPYHDGPLPSALAPTLIQRFNSKDGYTLYPDVLAYIRQLSASPHRKPGSANRIVVGVITNSDDRVPDVLSSLGLRVHHLRHGSAVSVEDQRDEKAEAEGRDIDFAIMSYDVGFEKPHRRMFDAATDMLKAILSAEGQGDVDLARWDLLYVGDEMEKDGRGATQAGWNAVVVDRDPKAAETPSVSYKTLVGGKEVDVVSDFTAMRNLKAQYPLILG